MDSENSVTTGKTHKSFFSKHGLRQVVSQKRVRFQDGEFDLDLSYICPNILAMGLPANGVDGLFRNNEQDVSKMLNKFHPGSYTIFNLAQKKYDYSLFNKVVDLGWKDHHAPGLELLFQNVNEMCEFLKQDFKNVVIIHCKAGKGRTGTSIAALLVYCGLYRTPEEALKYFSYRRANTIDPKGGVTIPSQKRYIKYFADILSGTQTPNKNKYKINSISISGVPMYDKKNGAKLMVSVMHDTVVELYKGKSEIMKLEPVTNTQGTFQHPDLQKVELDGDVMLKFSNVGFLKEDVKFRISFNTYMIEGDEIYWVFYRHDLDDAYKDDEVPSQFKLELRMTKCGEATASAPGITSQWERALKNRHLYQNMFSKMSYQASTIYDPANNIGDYMEDVPNFLSQPQQVINGVVVGDQNSQNSIADMESWEARQEENFNREQAMLGTMALQASGARVVASPISGQHQQIPSQNPISPRMSTCYQSFSNQSGGLGVSAAPPALPRRTKPSLTQWEAYFQQHQVTSNSPASILGVMLQLPQSPIPPPPSSTSPIAQQQQQQAPVAQQPVLQTAAIQPAASPTYAQYQQQNTYQQPLMQTSVLPPPPAPPSTPKPTHPAPLASNSAMYSPYNNTPALAVSVNNGNDHLPPPPVPPTPGGTQYNTSATPSYLQSQQAQPTSGYASYYGQQSSYGQQFQQFQALQASPSASGAPVLPRRPPMMPPGQQPQ